MQTKSSGFVFTPYHHENCHGCLFKLQAISSSLIKTGLLEAVSQAGRAFKTEDGGVSQMA